MRRVTSQNLSPPATHGYFRVNQERALRAAKRRGFQNPTQVAKALTDTVAEGTFFRAWYDEHVPSGRLMYSLTTLLGVSVEEIFDPVLLPAGVRTPAQRKRSA